MVARMGDGIVWPVETPTTSKDAMAADDARGQMPSAHHEDLPVDSAAARAAFLSATRFAAVAAIGGLCFGWDISVTNRAVKALQANFHIGNALLGFAAASAVMGAAVGAVLAGRIADRMGRRAMMKLAAVLFFVCGLGAGLASSIWMFIVFHTIYGIGIGLSSVAAPAYIAEISPPRFRGRLGSLQQLAIVCGIFGALALTWLPFHLAGGSGKPLWLGLAAWRWTYLSELAPALLYVGLLFSIPESPRYLVAKKQLSQARRVLSALLGARDVEPTISRIADTLEQEQPQSWRDLRRPTGGLYGIVWVGLGLAVFQQFVGINVIFSYSDLLWEAVGFGEKSSFTIALVTTGVNVLITLVAIALIDRLGRRPLLLAGSAGMSVMLATMTVVFAGASTVNGQPRLVRRRVRRVLGAGAVGAAGRDVPQPHPVGGAGPGLGRAVDGQLDYRGDVPGPAPRARCGLRLLHAVRGAVACFRLAMGPRNQRGVTGRHARRRVSDCRTARRDLKPP
jgi:SP family sugar:H+ symporter-like MFS transporter